MLASGLRFEEVKLLTVYEDRILRSETIFKTFGRVRGHGVGPDGAIYIVLIGPDIVVRLSEKSSGARVRRGLRARQDRPERV